MSQSKPRILHVITSLAVGGAQRHLLTLLSGLRDSYEMDVVYFKDSDLAPQVAGVAERLDQFRLDRFPSPRELWRFVNHVKAGQYAIVHTHLLKADAWGTLAGRAAGAPVIVSSKHNCEEALQNPAYGHIHGLLTRFAGAVIAVSSSVAEYVVTTGRVEGPKIVVIHYGIKDVDQSPRKPADLVRAGLGLDPGDPLALCAARLDPQKDHQTLLQAWKHVIERMESARLLLVGDTQLGGNAYVDGLEQLAAALGISDAIIFAGVRDDVDDLMAACDVFVMSSRWEGLGLVFLEAMRAGRPVVATRVGGIPEVVIDGETGYLVDVGDSAALAARLVRLLEDRATATRMGKQGRDRFEHRFAAEQMLNKISGLYAKLIGETSSKQAVTSRGSE